MRSATSWIIAIIILIIVVGGGWWLLNSNQATTTNTTVTTGTPTGQTTTANNPGGTDYTPGNTNTDAPGSLDGSVSGTVGTPTTVTVTYNGSSFSPSTVTIHAGDTVHFVGAGGGMWVASDVHPSHTNYDGTSRSTHCAAGYAGPAPFDQCASGSSYSFTFTKAGTYSYHNHVDAGATGKVIVQ